MDRIMNLTFASSLTDLCEVNSSFDKGVLRICYVGENRNGSYFSKEVIERCIPTIYNCPLVCNYDRETDSFGGHDVEVVSDDDGNMRIVNMTTPVGVIPESARVWFDDYEEDDGTVHKYLYADVLLWKRQEAYRKIKNDGVTAHSMEIKVKGGKSVNGVYRVDDFEFNAFALIGVLPCFQSSALEVFSQSDFKQKVSEMMRDLKESFALVNSSSEVDNKENHLMEGGRGLGEIDEKLALAAEYGIDVDSLDFAVNDFTVDELREKFGEMKASAEEPAAEPVNEEPVAEPAEEPAAPEDKFALTSAIVDEIRRALECNKASHEWGECPRYMYVDCDIEAGEVYCIDEADWLLYGFAFSVDGDAVSVDYESKKRKKYVIADFEGGEPSEQESPIAPVFNLMEDKLKGYAEVESQFAAASNTIASMQGELEELRVFKAEIDNKVAKAERDSVFAQFSDLVGIEAFEALKEKCMEYDVATLEEKCFAIRGRNATTMKFSVKPRAAKLPIEKSCTIDEKEPYGGIVKKYGADKI